MDRKERICEVLCGRKNCPDDITFCDGKKLFKCQEKNTSFIKSLNEEQVEYILSSLDENIFLKACPGSGKTEVLAIKCAYENVLWEKKTQGYALLTFTNSAENEISGRQESYIGEKLRYPHFVGTFTSWIHGYIANPFMSKITEYKGNEDKDKSIKLIDSASTSDFLNIYSTRYKYVELGNIKAHEYFRDFKYDEFTYCGKRSRDGKEILRQLIAADDWREPELDELKKRFWKNGYCLYEDVEYLVYFLLIENDEICKLLSKRFTVIFIDECQDLSYVQLEIVRILKEKGCNIHLIGDLDQAIYDFRNIEPKDTLDFIQDISFKELQLNQNYRSSQKIVDISDLIIARNSNILGCNVSKVEDPLIVLLYKKDKEYEAIKHYRKLIEENYLEENNSRIIVRNNNLKNKLLGIKSSAQSSNLLEDVAQSIYLSINSKDITEFKTGFLLLAKSIQKMYFTEEEHLNGNYFYKPSNWEIIDWKKLIGSVKLILNESGELRDFTKTWTLWKKSLKKVLEEKVCTLRELSEKELILGSIRIGNSKKTVEEILFTRTGSVSNLKIETIHGCKGMSLDAVLVISSYQATKDFGSGAYWRQWFDRTVIEEKNRLAYVAFSRAKYLLALAIPKPSTFTMEDSKMLNECGFKIIDVEKYNASAN